MSSSPRAATGAAKNPPARRGFGDRGRVLLADEPLHGSRYRSTIGLVQTEHAMFSFFEQYSYEQGRLSRSVGFVEDCTYGRQ